MSEQKKLSKREAAAREALLFEAKLMRASAAGLQREVDNGVAIRQSIESKESRIQVLEACADSVERIINAHFGAARARSARQWLNEAK